MVPLSDVPDSSGDFWDIRSASVDAGSSGGCGEAGDAEEENPGEGPWAQLAKNKAHKAKNESRFMV